MSPELAESYGKVPLSFEPNRGQTDARVQFLSRGPGYGIFLTPGEAVLSFQGKDFQGKDKAAGQSVLQMKLVGANASAVVEAQDKLPGTANYMKGTDPAKWATGVPTYQKVKYAGVYPGVDLVFYGNQRQLEYDFVVAPGRDAGRISLEFAGATPVVDAAGDLEFGDAGGAKFHKPVVYQMVGGESVAVAGEYEVQGQRVGFRLGRYDHSRALVIDPVVTYLTYLGGSADGYITAIAVDSSGAAYVTGQTSAIDFPLKNAYESSFPSGKTAMFVSKLNQSGTSLVYSTFLSSNGNTVGNAIAVDSSGSAYVGGYTDTTGFPVTSGAFQALCGAEQNSSGTRIDGCTGKAPTDSSGVLAKLSADGTALTYATYLGGNGTTDIYGVAVDATGEAYVTGFTGSHCGLGPYSTSGFESFQCFPTTDGAAQSSTIIPTTGAQYYAFLTKFDAAGATLKYSSVLGDAVAGSNPLVIGYAVAVNANGVAYITGQGGNGLYTTAGSFQPTGSVNGNAAFVAAFDTNAGSLTYSTYLGGQNAPYDAGHGISADSNNNAYVAGLTKDCDFPTTTGAFDTQAQYASTDTANVGKCETGFVAKVNPSGSALVWATYLGSAPLTTGTTAQQEALALALDNSVYVAGYAAGSGYPLKNPVLPQGNTSSVPVVTHLSADGSSVLFSSTVGGPVSAFEFADAVAVDSTGAIYLAGATSEQYLPTTNNVVQPTFAGTPGSTSNGFVAKISPSTPPMPSNGLTTNLLANPGAELGSIADWTPGGAGTPVVDSGTFAPGINPHTGSYDFVGGADVDSDSLSQTVSIIQQGITAAQVDGGTLFANVSFWEQGLNQGNPSDEGSVTLTFLDANNAAIGNTVTIGPEDSHDGTWANVTGVPAIPVGTRSITYTMNFVRGEDSNTLAAFIDDNVLSIHTNTGLTIFPSTLHFGNVPVGQTSAAQTVSVTNQGTTTINISQIISELGANPADFLQTNTCGASLAPGASCTVTITFAPGGVGPKSAGIAINTDSVPALQQISVDGTGLGGILQVNPGNLKTVAGNGTTGDSGDGGQAILAQLNQPNGVAFDPSGNLYIADDNANVIRKVDTTGKITTFAGTAGIGGFAGDGGLATQAELLIPFSVTSDKNGNIYIQDTGNYVIRKVDATTGIITTVAGTPGAPGRAGDGGPATAAKLNENQGARFDSAGNLYLAVCPTGTIRKIDTAGVITTVAGTPGSPGFAGDGGQATAAQLQCPSGVTIDAAGNFYIADEFNQVIRKVDTTGKISTIAGTPGVAGFSGDGGAATSAKFNNPNDVAIDAAGKNLYVPDSGNNRVRKIDLTTGIITTASGGLNSAGSAGVNTPLAVTLDTAGNVYFSDSGNSEIQEIFPQGTQPFPATAVGQTSAAKSLTLSNIGNVPVTLGASGTFTTSGNAGDFSLSAGSCTGGLVLAANGGSCAVSITFKPTAAGQRTLTVGIADNALNTPQSFTIGGTGTAAGQITPTITWPAPLGILYGTALSSTQLNAVATGTGGVTVNGTFVYTPAAGTVLTAGTHPLSVTFTPTTAGYGPATATNSITVAQFSPILTWATPAPITTATPLSATQLDAAATDINGATVAGTYYYTPDVGTLLAAGTQQLTVTFAPNDTVDFTASNTTTRSIVVTQASSATTATTLTVTSPGTAGSAVTTVASGAVVTLTASVTASGNSVSPGQVAFCDGGCTGGNRLATMQLVGGDATSTATYKFVPGIGSHSYKAVFLGTAAYTGSSSIASALAVTGVYPTATTIAQSGSAGNYTLTATTVGVSPPPVKASTQNVTVSLGQSAQSYVLTGTGASTVNGATYGNYYNTQGSCVTAGSTTTCDLTGNFTGNTATYAAGTYDFQTVFTGSITSAVLSQTQYPVGQTEPNGFVYTAFAASTTMTLKLNVTGGGSYSIPVAANGNLATSLLGLGFATVSPVCGGTSLGSDPCQQDYVGTVVGATYSGAVTGTVQFTVSTPASGGPTGPTGTVSFEDTSNSNAVLGTGALGASTAAFTVAQAAGSPVTVGKGPYGMDTGDLNGDGIADLVVQNYTSGTVSVLLGKGDGTFQTQVTYPVGVKPERVLLADLNGDGKLDMVVANTGSNTIGVLLGNGDGTFKAQVTYACGSPVGLGVMDINHDGIPDVVAGDYYANTMSVLLGKGDGTLKAAVTYATGSTPQTVAEGDFNGDGNVDVVVGNFGGATVGVFLGKGDGTFTTMVTYPVGKQPQGVQVGDFNGDGKADLAVSNSGDGTIGVLLGKGDGTFQTEATYPVGVQPVGLAIADFNGDGIADITVGNTGQASLTQSVLLGKGDGTFQAQQTFATGNFPYGTTTGDFNGDGLPDIVAANYNDGTVTIFLSQPTETAVASATGIAPTATGTHAVVASYAGDTNYAKSISTATNLTVSATTPVITWATPANIVYGTALSATQLDATAATAAGVAIPGTFTYSPALGTVPTAGTQTLKVTFAPTSTSYSAATATVTITVTQAVPTITWAAPAGIAYGTALSATQLDATVTGVGGTALPGTLVYAPAAGTVLSPGTQTLSVAFAPTDGVDYTAASATVQIVVGGLSLTAISPTGVVAGAANTTVTLTGTGFVPTSLVDLGSSALATTYVSPTMLTAVVPAALLKTAVALQMTVVDPSLGAATAAQTFSVVPPAGAATLTGPATTASGSQPSVGLTITNPYPLALTAEFTLAFASATTPEVNDGSIVFSTGGRTFSYVVAANSTTVPPVQLQAGTVAGTITVTAKLTAAGVDVTPTALVPLVIVVPPVVPVISGTTVTRSGDTLTVVVHGFSNTREVSQAVFEFTAATGDTLATPKLTIPATPIFGDWFGKPESDQYGSAFTYTQVFDTSGGASTVGPVKVTLTNSVGASAAGTGP